MAQDPDPVPASPEKLGASNCAAQESFRLEIKRSTGHPTDRLHADRRRMSSCLVASDRMNLPPKGDLQSQNGHHGGGEE